MFLGVKKAYRHRRRMNYSIYHKDKNLIVVDVEL